MSIASIPAFALGDTGKSTDGYPGFLTDALRLVQQLFLVPTGPKIVVFAGLEHQSGCTSISAAVAGTIARQTQRPVCLVETNLRSPSLAEKFGLKDGNGLSEAIEQEGPIQPFLKKLSDEQLWLLPAGRKIPGTNGVLNSSLMGKRIAELKSAFDFVIIDAAPIGESSDAFALCQFADGVVLVLEAGKTRKETARVAESNLRAAGIPILGGVLNKRTFPIPEFLYSRL
jgi:capsular exopolysaccharide synthesis family protein